MLHYKFTVVLKSGARFTNRESVDQKFVDTMYKAIQEDSLGVVQVAVNKKRAMMIPPKNIDYIEILIVRS